MNPTVERRCWTIHDLEFLPQDEWIVYELIGGELFVTRAPHFKHQRASGEIFQALNIWSKASNLGITIITPGIVLSDADHVIPDVVWVSNERLALLVDEAGHLIGAPELVVEVLSPGQENERRDREAKLSLYLATGVQEYWIANYLTKQVEIYRRENDKLILVTTLFGQDTIDSPLLPGFASSIASFFPTV